MSSPPRKIGLLLGAGFSYDLGMPLAQELTEVLLKPITPRTAGELARAMTRARPYGADRPLNEPALLTGGSSRINSYQAFGPLAASISSTISMRWHRHGVSLKAVVLECRLYRRVFLLATRLQV